MNSFRKISFAAVSLLIPLLSGYAPAQSADHNIRDAGLAPGVQPQKNVMAFELKLNEGQTAFGGLQFQIDLDPSISSVNLASCLAGVPETHVGGFTSCDYLPGKNQIRVAITDLGKNRLIPAGMLGVIELTGPATLSADQVTVSRFRALDLKGKSIMGSEADSFIELSTLK